MLLNGILSSFTLFSTLLYKQLQIKVVYNNQASICSNQISFNNNVHQMISFCYKQSYLNQQQLTGSILSSKPSLVFHSLYTETVQNMALNINYKMTEFYSFALFGFTTKIRIQNSILSVRIPQQLAQSALVCFSCDLHLLSSDFAFAAFGQNVSGIVLNTYNNMTMIDLLIQFRLSGVNVGGLLLQSQQSLLQISVVNISGYVSASNVSGSLMAFVQDVIQISVNSSKICSNLDRYAGLNSANLQLVGSFIISCDICRSKSYAYGLCSAYLENGELIDNIFVCKNSSEFNGEQCQCPDDQVLNGSLCISVLNSVNEVIQRQLMLNQRIRSLNVSGLETKVKELENIQQYISVEIEEFKNMNKEIQNNIISNSSSIQNYIVLNTMNVLNNLERNSTVLDWRIYNNMTSLNNDFKSLNQIFDDLNSSAAILDDNIHAQKDSNTILQENIYNLSTQIQTQNDDIMQQQLVLTNLSRKISCMNDYSSYQQCPCYFDTPGTTLVNDVCICTPGASMVVNKCICTPGASIVNGACVCTANSILSNGICVCQPLNTILQSGICVCTITGQSIVGGVCTCPAGSTLSGSTCVCNVAGSTLQSNKCVCTQDYKASWLYFNGGNFWCQDIQLCCSTNDSGPSYSCSNGNTYWSGCRSYTSYVTE
ncbi:Conserved_hypothetical protein [Hexamita inflata]|uniref:Uncharacterized protein n=1 Tax=Hexamita inflata TaxID=28002 RepID=A0AA86PRX1_9EUKA|nr:Conserved hypothetical protein [Hexamita inflata]